MSEEHERRLAAREAIARDVNEVVDDVAASWYEGDERIAFRCECSHDCGGHVELTPQEYEAVRAGSDTFVLLDGHQDPAVERVTGRIREYVLVEKTGVGRDVARETDPRRDD